MSERIDPAHPALPGHFPGHPVVPGVVILDHLRQALLASSPDQRIGRIIQVKFLRPLLPDQAFELELDIQVPRCRFRVQGSDGLIAQGELVLEARRS